MMDEWATLLALALGGLALLLVSRSLVRRTVRRRRDAHALVAARHELQGDGCVRRAAHLLVPDLPGGEPRARPDEPHDPKEGENEVLLFDYRYPVRTQVSRFRYVEQTVAGFFLAGRGLPGFTLRPEGLVEKFGAALGMQDIDFAAQPAFSNSYVLQGADEEAVRALFTDEVLRQFGDQKGWWIEGWNEWLLIYKRKSRPSTEHVGDFLRETRRLARLFEPI